MPTLTICDRIRKVTDINEKRYDLTDKERFHNNLIEFSFFAKKVIKQMKDLRKLIEGSLVIKRQGNGHQKVLFNLLEKYEELNLKIYLTENPLNHKQVFYKEYNQDLNVAMEHVAENLKNPFEEMYHWSKGEVYDIQALLDAVQLRDSIEKNMKKQEYTKQNTQNDLDNVQTGKKTYRTIFKNQNDTGGMVNKIELVSISNLFYMCFRLKRKLRT